MATTTTTQYTLSPQQEAALNWVKSSQGSLILNAYAGTGKTSTLMEMAKVIKGQGYMGAFNKAIAEEFKERLARQGSYHVKGATLHSAGFAAWARTIPGNVDVASRKVEQLAKQKLPLPADNKLRQVIKDAVGYAKQACLGVEGAPPIDDVLPWVDIIEYYDLDEEIPWGVTRERFIQHCQSIYQESLDLCKESIDFDDMLLAPLFFKVPIKKYEWVMIDECFIGDTPVMISESQTMAIREMVESKYSGTVASFRNNETVYSKVIGWHKIALAKSLVRIVARRVIRNSKGERLSPQTAYVRHGNRFVVCTSDQLFLEANDQAPLRWVEAGKLKVGDLLVQESHAPKDYKYNDKYKHGPAGLKRLSSEMTKKNKAGTCGGATGAFKITKRGGNGTGLTSHQQALLDRLGKPWVAEHVIAVGKGRHSGYPTCYKVDLANPVDMVAIEIDGASHNLKSRQAQDKKKDEFLKSRGWAVIRLSNAESITLTHELIQEMAANSPVLCEVVSIEPFTPTDPYVYDIDVESTHNFYANGVVVHNCQDTNMARRMLAFEMMRKDSRMVAVGDRFQSIYGFSGANSNSMDLIAEEMTKRGPFQELPLSVTYRCPKSVVGVAREWVPDFTAFEANPQGLVTRMNHYDFFQQSFQWNDAILCRNTRPLVGIADRLRESGVACIVEGGSGRGLRNLAGKWGEDLDLDEFLEHLEEYEAKEVAKWDKKGKLDKVEFVQDRCGILRDMAAKLGYVRRRAAVEGDGWGEVTAVSKPVAFEKTTKHLIQKIDFMFGESNQNVLRLCTIHRSKGREWNRVYLVGRNRYMPSPYAKKPWELAQESNLAYVAVTRAKVELVEVDVPFRDKRKEMEWWEK
jgi:superfamily I DNA/RNA helicase